MGSKWKTTACGKLLLDSEPEQPLCSRPMAWPPSTLPAGFIEPCLPTRSPQPPSGGEWVHERSNTITRYQQGQGIHGSFSRADTMNFMAAIGPDFKSGFVNEAPVSNADVGKTLAFILGLKISNKGKLVGRVIAEAMPQAKSPAVITRTLVLRRASMGCARFLSISRWDVISMWPGFRAGPSAWRQANR